MSVRLSVCPSVCLSVCLSVHLVRSVCRSCLCHVASREVWVQPSRDTVVLGNTHAFCFFYVFRRCGEVSPQLGREVPGLTQRKPKSLLFRVGGHGGGREPPKNPQSCQGPRAHRRTPGRVVGAAGAGSPRERARGPCRSAKKFEKLENILFL